MNGLLATVDAATQCKALFQQLFESSPDAILVAAADGKIVEANPQAVQLFGYTREELLALKVESLMPERFRQIHPEHRRDYQSSPHVRQMGVDLKLYGLHKDGHEFPVDIMLSPARIDGEELVLAVVRDITRRKLAEEALRQSEERFRFLVEGARDYAIFMLDSEGKVKTWNPGAERIKGYRAEDIIGKHFSVFYTQADVERGKPAHELEEARDTGRYEDEGWRVRQDGSRFWANVVITAHKDQHGNVNGFSKVTRDFTNRKRAEEALLTELSKAVLTRLDIQQMFSAIAASLQPLAPHDYATIAIYNTTTERLHLLLWSAREAVGTREEIVVPLEGTPDGRVYVTQRALFLDRLDPSKFATQGLAHYMKLGVKSGCWLPLDNHGKVIGTLSLGSLRESAFDPGDVNTLLRLSSTVAAVLDSAYALQQITGLSEKLRQEKRYLEEELRTEYNFEEIIGTSNGLKHTLKQVETVAPTDATVLILGETGTGKELIARAIHEHSSRGDHTFVKLNCSAIPSGLLESELFGHEKGAFTGAIAQRIGRLELAHQGTLFLDEIGDLPLDLQPKLLRALQEREIERLGGRKVISVNVRLIAATNRDLAKMMKEGQFRSDLYYRLKVFPITVPALRHRRDDIPLLVNYFVAKHARRMGKQIDSVPGEIMRALVKWHWPGNVRELENFIERAVILTQRSSLRAPLAELELAEEGVATPDRDLRATERNHILHVLRESKGMIGGQGGAAERLGVKRTTLNSKLKKLGITKEDYS